ncbi:protein jag [Desulfurivibrio dismutans]|uniref:Jag family protein n=1 Tax=Desulfurivibrio dismutans TaxID=1398908 RepID=UPI0023D9FF65|nr:protein jag [Desulfurivibrio alkaliphilus]MDF1614255.1 Jag N-terminal domain-containing protein [Desulfurivibrio alkaliphilus]
MSTLMEYKGADVEQAVAGACSALGVPREALEIQVINTGSAGIFGIGRRQAVIRVGLRQEPGAVEEENGAAPAAGREEAASEAADELRQENAGTASGRPGKGKPAAAKGPASAKAEQKSKRAGRAAVDQPWAARDPMEPLSTGELEAVQNTISRLLELSVGPARVRLQQDQNSGKLLADLEVEDGVGRDRLVGPQGQTLEALQYLLRKMVSKQLGKRVALELDAAGFRAERRALLEDRARELAAEAKSSGKTRTMAAMGPAERRIVHLALQGDSEVRSRSVGEGIFKKIIIHPPGKARRRRKR